jgi:hypothetical protein
MSILSIIESSPAAVLVKTTTNKNKIFQIFQIFQIFLKTIFVGFLISVCSKVDGNESLKHQRTEIYKEKCKNNVFDNGDNDDGGDNDGDNNDSDNNNDVNNSQIIITSLKKAGEIIPILILILFLLTH